MSGTNLLMEVDGDRARYEFTVVRYVEAMGPTQAAEVALALVREAPQVRRGALNPPADPPRYRVEEVLALAPDEAVPAQQPGFAFYPPA